MSALSYVPPEKVVEYYETVILQMLEDKEQEAESSSEEDKEAEEKKVNNSWGECVERIYTFVDYADRTWIGKRSQVSTRNATAVSRRKPLFQHQLWNQFKLVVTKEEAGSLEGTNNTVESFNRVLNKLLGPNPNIWEAIDCFVKQEAESRHVLVNNAAGLGLTGNTGRKKNLEQSHAMLCATVRRIDDMSPTLYLKAVACILNRDD